MIFFVMSVLNFGFVGLSAQSQKQFHFTAYETQFEVQEDANIAVTENLTYYFEGGAFSRAFRYINLYKLESVEAVHVIGSEGEFYTQVDPTDDTLPPGHFFVKNELTRVVIEWFYEVNAQISPVEKSFTLKYVLTKAVQREDVMDVLDVDAVPVDTPRVDRVEVTTIFPGEFSEDELSIASENMRDLTSYTLEGGKTILQFELQNLPSRNAYRVIVGFPPTVQAYVSPKRLINDTAWIFGIFWIFIAIIFSIYLYWVRGRDPTVRVPTELSIKFDPRPPQGLLPGEGVALLKEGRDPSLAAFATFADLARQGYIRIEAAEFKDTNPRITITDQGKEVLATKGLIELLPIEEKLLRMLYELEKEMQPEILTMEELQHNKNVLKAIGSEIMDRTVKAGYFDDDPREVRSSYGKKVGFYFLGTTLMVLLLFILYRAWGGLVLLGASITSTICLAAVIPSLPRKNERGAAKTNEYELFLKEVRRRAEGARSEHDPKTAAQLIEEFFPWLLITSIPTSFSLYNWLKAIETMPNARRYPFPCSWYTYPHLSVTSEPSPIGSTSPGVPSSLSSFAQSFSASLGTIATSMGATSAGGGFGAGAGVGGGGGAGGGGAGAT